MSKRFTDTEIWDKEWFMLLKPKHKCLVKYVRDKCDIAGVWHPNWLLATTYIGEKVTQAELLEIDGGKQFLMTDDKKVFCIGFINFQYGDYLNEKSPVHKKIIDILGRFKVKGNTLFDTLYNTLPDTLSQEPDGTPNTLLEGEKSTENPSFNTLSDTPQEEEEEKEVDKEEDKERDKEEVSKPEVKTVANPFSEHFTPHWERWKDYKRDQHRFTFKTADSEQSALNDLVKMAKGDEVTAAAIIQQSIAKGWKGLFEIKDNQNANSKTNNGTPNGKATNTGLNTAFIKFHSKGRPVTVDG